MFTSWFCHDILCHKVQLCLQIGYTVILHSLSWFLCKDNCLQVVPCFVRYFMSFLCQNILHWNVILLLVQWDCNLTAGISLGGNLMLKATGRNHTDHCQKSVGQVQTRMAMWNLVHLQCIEIILGISTQRLFVCARSWPFILHALGAFWLNFLSYME